MSYTFTINRIEKSLVQLLLLPQIINTNMVSKRWGVNLNRSVSFFSFVDLVRSMILLIVLSFFRDRKTWLFHQDSNQITKRWLFFADHHVAVFVKLNRQLVELQFRKIRLRRLPIIAELSSDSIHSPFHLTNGDNPGLSLISEVLDGTNYDNWCSAMKIALDAKNKLAFIDGSTGRPLESHHQFRIWYRCNSMVKSWILNTVSKQIYKSILRFNDAEEIWKLVFTSQIFQDLISYLNRFGPSSKAQWIWLHTTPLLRLSGMS